MRAARSLLRVGALMNSVLEMLSSKLSDFVMRWRTIARGGGFQSRGCRYIKVKQRANTALAYQHHTDTLSTLPQHYISAIKRHLRDQKSPPGRRYG